MNSDEIQAYRELKTHGINVQKTSNVKPNSGSETWPHFQAKACVAYLGQINGYRVDSEVDFDNGRECDILLWGHSSRHNVVVECETNWSGETKKQKLGHYVDGYAPIGDMLCIEVLDVPDSSLDALKYVSDQIGLDP